MDLSQRRAQLKIVFTNILERTKTIKIRGERTNERFLYLNKLTNIMKVRHKFGRQRNRMKIRKPNKMGQEFE